jgi:transposase
VTTVTVLSGPERRRRWTTAEKLRIVEESLAPGASVVEVARRHDVHPNLLTVWRRQARTGAFGCGTEVASRQDDDVHFAAVSVAPEQQTLMAPSGSCGAIEIEFANGARLRITGVVDKATLTAAVAVLADGRPR